MARETKGHTFLVTGTLAVLCSLLVSLTAIGLGERQARNRELDRRKNILQVAGLYEPQVDIDAVYANVETRLIELDSGRYLSDEEAPVDYDQRLATSVPGLSDPVPGAEDTAGIGRREKYSYVYLVNDGDGLDQVILPVRGRGLFSTLYAFISLDADLETIRGIAFYKHGETAGLGAQVEDPAWRALWPGKRLYGDDGAIELAVIKGVVDPADSNADYQIDGLSGATMTSIGVTRLVQYWFGESGFGPYLDRLRQEGGARG